MGIILDGKKVSEEIRVQIKNTVDKLHNEGKAPGLAVVIVGDNPASQVYVRNKEKMCQELGFYSIKIELSANSTTENVINTIEELNKNDRVHGILCQLPMPKHIDERRVLESINKEKDVDVFKAENMGSLVIGNQNISSCTPAGIMKLLDYYNIDIEGKHCVIVGRSNIVGKPLSLLMLQRNATVTVCHSKTNNLKDICRTADILVAAVGKRDLITPDMVKEGVVIIDVGMNRNEMGKLCGDVSKETYEKASYYTPVPGGVGPMTMAMLMTNTLLLAEKSWSK